MGYFDSSDAAPEPQYKLLASVFPESWPAPLSNLFCGLLLLLTILEGMRRLKTATTPTTERVTRQTKGKASEFNAFQREYLAVYLVIMLADWLQGTNMYTLYSGYGVSVSTLFLTGFSSSLVFGTFVGLLVDAYGRKRACVLFCLLEIAINVMEHVPSMPVLLLGRVLGGISTSYFSVRSSRGWSPNIGGGASPRRGSRRRSGYLQRATVPSPSSRGYWPKSLLM